MHHPGLLLIVLIFALLLAPQLGQALTALGAFAGPLLAAAPGAAALGNLAAPMLVPVVLLLGVAVVAAIKLVFGV